MESFSSSIKQYLCQRSFEELGFGEKVRVKWKLCCGQAFLRAVFLFLAHKEKDRVSLFSRQRELLELAAYLLIRHFDLEAKVLSDGTTGAIYLPGDSRERILKETETVLKEDCDNCRILFVRAAFLSCGTVLDPKKGYHAAFLTSGEEEAAELLEVLLQFGVPARSRKEKKGNLLYLKESGKIEDLLSIIGAQRFSLELMNQKIEKSIRGNINRRQNFDDANLKKTVFGAQSVIAAIRYLEERGVLNHLSDSLQKAAKLRMSYPEVSLQELCERSEEEITKSGLNHRLQKLLTLAKDHRKKEEENEK